MPKEMLNQSNNIKQSINDQFGQLTLDLQPSNDLENVPYGSSVFSVTPLSKVPCDSEVAADHFFSTSTIEILDISKNHFNLTNYPDKLKNTYGTPPDNCVEDCIIELSASTETLETPCNDKEDNMENLTSHASGMTKTLNIEICSSDSNGTTPMETETKTPDDTFNDSIIDSDVDADDDSDFRNNSYLDDLSDTDSLISSSSVARSYRSDASLSTSISSRSRSASSLLKENLSRSSSRSSLSDKSRRCNFSCEVPGCDKKFSRPSRLEQHSRIHTGARPYVCLTCCRSYTRAQHLKRHQQVSHGQTQQAATTQEFKCEACDNKTYSSVYSLRKHQSQFHERSKYRCQECGLCFCKQQQLRTHALQHSNDKRNYRCDHPGCCESFVTSSRLSRHKKIHNPGRFRCTRDSSCLLMFDRYSDLRKHIMTCHPYKCEVCGVQFQQLNRYNSHRATHADKRLAFHCMEADCGRSYFSMKSLICHVRDKHDKDKKDLSCVHCSRNFSTKQKLSLHMKIHSEKYVREQTKVQDKTRAQRKDKGIGKVDYRKLLAGIPEADKNEEAAEGSEQDERGVRLSKSSESIVERVNLESTAAKNEEFGNIVGTRRALIGGIIERNEHQTQKLLKSSLYISLTLNKTVAGKNNDSSHPTSRATYNNLTRSNPDIHDTVEKYVEPRNNSCSVVIKKSNEIDVVLKESKVVLSRCNSETVAMLQECSIKD